MVTVTITIDTEEDDWGSYAAHGASTRNIAHLTELHEHFERVGAKPTYLVNRPPLVNDASVRVLGALALRPDVEIGGHCHPWNTPPSMEEGKPHSMMSNLSVEQNRGKIREITGRIQSELGVRPESFRAGRWAFGPSVAEALVAERYSIDCSVSPFIDWSGLGGPDYGSAPHLPYWCRPSRPLRPDPSGPLLELPTTVGFVRGHPIRAARRRRRYEESVLARLRIGGILNHAGLWPHRWLSPEAATGSEMIRVSKAAIRHGARYLSMTLHSCALLPGATPFVRDDEDRRKLLLRLDAFLTFCRDSGFSFKTLSGAAKDPDLLAAAGAVSTP